MSDLVPRADGPTAAADDGPLPVVRPWMLRDDACALRQRLDHGRRYTTSSSWGQGRIVNPFTDAVEQCHDELAEPDRRWFAPPDRLVSEERVVWEAAVDGYLVHFGGRPAQTARGEVDRPRLGRRRVQLAGTLGVAVETPDGPELRRFAFGGRRPPRADPTDDVGVLLAVLRLVRWADGRPLRVEAVDLVGGRADVAVVDPGTVGHLGALLDERLAVLAEQVADGTPRPGVECATCNHPPACSVHRAVVPMLG